MIYTHVIKVAAGGTASPLDALPASVAQAKEPDAEYFDAARYSPITSVNFSALSLDCC